MKISFRLFIWYRFTCILYRRGSDKTHHHDHETDLYVSHGKVDGKDAHETDLYVSHGKVDGKDAHKTDLYVSHGKVDGKDDHDADNSDDEHEDNHMALELDILKSITSALSEILENLAPFNLI